MSTIKNKTFSSGKSAIANARSLHSKSEISKRDLARVIQQASPAKGSSKGSKR